MARLWGKTAAVALSAAVAMACVVLGLQGAALADSKKPRFGTHPPVEIKPYSKRFVLSCMAATATNEAGQHVALYDPMRGYSIDFKVSSQMNGCSAWSHASLIRRR